jgi:hypothetical protein
VPAWPAGKAYKNTGLRSSELQPQRLGEGSAPQRAAAGRDSAQHIVHNIVEDQNNTKNNIAFIVKEMNHCFIYC